MKILVINCGSSSLKFQLIDSETEAVIGKGLCERIGIDGRLNFTPAGKDKIEREVAMPDHNEAIRLVIEALTDAAKNISLNNSLKELGDGEEVGAIINKKEYGNLKITKKLEKFNKSLGTATFVFSVEAVDTNGKNVFSNVYSMDFTSATTQSITIEKLPAGAKVTVEEIYSGGSYKSQDESLVKEVTIVANQTVEVTYNNTYNDERDEGTISIVNKFSKKEDKWTGERITKGVTDNEE